MFDYVASITRKKAFGTLLGFTVVTSIPLSTLAAVQELEPIKVCAGEAEAKRFEGEYSSEIFLTALTRTKSLIAAFKADQNRGEAPSAVNVGPDRILLSYGWHDAGDAECVTIKGSQLFLEGSPRSYVRVSPDIWPNNERGYFDLVFSGCFKDETGENWCFKPGLIEVGEKKHPAALVLDPSEHPLENPVHIDGDDAHFWFFRPTSEGGWQVFQGGWLTDGSPPVDWEHPWRVLQPRS